MLSEQNVVLGIVDDFIGDSHLLSAPGVSKHGALPIVTSSATLFAGFPVSITNNDDAERNPQRCLQQGASRYVDLLATSEYRGASANLRAGPGP